MIKHLKQSLVFIVLGLLLCLLVYLDRYYLNRSILDGNFWSPVTIVEPLLVDYGDIAAADDVRREVIVKNTGWSPLVIEKVLLSCASCITIHSYPTEPIPSGKQGKIEFSLELPERSGHVKTSFVIVSNAQPQKVVLVEVTANILTENH